MHLPRPTRWRAFASASYRPFQAIAVGQAFTASYASDALFVPLLLRLGAPPGAGRGGRRRAGRRGSVAGVRAADPAPVEGQPALAHAGPGPRRGPWLGSGRDRGRVGRRLGEPAPGNRAHLGDRRHRPDRRRPVRLEHHPLDSRRAARCRTAFGRTQDGRSHHGPLDRPSPAGRLRPRCGDASDRSVGLRRLLHRRRNGIDSDSVGRGSASPSRASARRARDCRGHRNAARVPPLHARERYRLLRSGPDTRPFTLRPERPRDVGRLRRRPFRRRGGRRAGRLAGGGFLPPRRLVEPRAASQLPSSGTRGIVLRRGDPGRIRSRPYSSWSARRSSMAPATPGLWRPTSACTVSLRRRLVSTARAGSSARRRRPRAPGLSSARRRWLWRLRQPGPRTPPCTPGRRSVERSRCFGPKSRLRGAARPPLPPRSRFRSTAQTSHVAELESVPSEHL